MNHIIDLIIKGKKKEAIMYVQDNVIPFDEVLDEMITLNMHEDIPTLFRIAVRMNYIKFGRIKKEI